MSDDLQFLDKILDDRLARREATFGQERYDITGMRVFSTEMEATRAYGMGRLLQHGYPREWRGSVVCGKVESIIEDLQKSGDDNFFKLTSELKDKLWATVSPFAIMVDQDSTNDADTREATKDPVNDRYLVEAFMRTRRRALGEIVFVPDASYTNRLSRNKKTRYSITSKNVRVYIRRDDEVAKQYFFSPELIFKLPVDKIFGSSYSHNVHGLVRFTTSREPTDVSLSKVLKNIITTGKKDKRTTIPKSQMTHVSGRFIVDEHPSHIILEVNDDDGNKVTNAADFDKYDNDATLGYTYREAAKPMTVAKPTATSRGFGDPSALRMTIPDDGHSYVLCMSDNKDFRKAIVEDAIEEIKSLLPTSQT